MNASDIPNLGQLFDSRAADPGRSFGARDWLRIVFKYWFVILFSTALVGALVVLGVLRQPALYTASAQILVRTDQLGTPSILSGITAYREGLSEDPPPRRIETAISMLRSPAAIEAVVKQFNLREEDLRRKPLIVAIEPILKLVGNVMETILPKSADAFREDPLNGVIRGFNASLETAPIRSKGSDTTSNVIEVTLTGTDPVRTRTALEGLVQQYLQRNSMRARDLAEQAIVVLRQQTREAYEELTQSEREIMQFTSGQSGQSLAGSGGGKPKGLPGDASPTTKMRADLQDLESRLDEMRQTYTDDYDGVRALRAQIAALRGRLAADTRDIAEANVGLDMLDRRRSIAETRYIELQRKLDQIALYRQLEPTDREGRISAEAPRAPEETGKVLRILGLLVGPLAGLMLGLFIAAVLEFSDRRLQSPEAVRRHLGLEVLGTLQPRSRLPKVLR